MLRKFVTIGATLGVFVAGFMFIGLMGAARPKVERRAPVIVPPTVFYLVAESKPVTLDVFAQGEVRPRTDIVLTAQVSGRVQSTGPGFVDGGAFEKDDLLLKIEDADYRVQVSAARARLAQAEQALRREEAESRLARKEYDELGKSGEASELTLRVPQLAQARAQYDSAKADLGAAQLNLERTNIRAPFRGRVRTRAVGEGQFVGPGAQLGRIFSTDVAEVRLILTDNDLGKLGLPFGFVETPERPGPPVELRGAIANQSHVWKGRIGRTDGAIDPATRQLAAIAVVDDPYGAGASAGAPLAVGLFVDARIAGRTLDNAIRIPRSALHGRDEVYVVGAGDVLEKRVVTIASAERDTIIVTAGLAVGDRVVTSPLRGADSGDKVAPQNPTRPDAAAPEDEPTPKSATDEALARGTRP
ncbi:MAG: efflux RND transporter periplasmic adaptor subunit [Parvularculaceae bacterium]|nr:efflux RND transporter periplasmic adaptor subunit [Parvularculaceae bacterium]